MARHRAQKPWIGLRFHGFCGYRIFLTHANKTRRALPRYDKKTGNKKARRTKKRGRDPIHFHFMPRHAPAQKSDDENHGRKATI
jgi:hypothetical protein